MRFHWSFVGRRVYPLVEDRRDRASGLSIGLTDNYLKVAIDSDRDLAPGSIVAANVTRAREDMVYGTAAGGRG